MSLYVFKFGISLILCFSLSLLADASKTSGVACTAERKAYATLRYIKCDSLMKTGWCFKGQEGALSILDQTLLQDLDPRNVQGVNNCTGFETSCEFLSFLTRVCAAQYRECHPQEERRSIIRMWIKQFVRETVAEVDHFEDKASSIKNGDCNNILDEYFNEEEVEDIVSLIAAPMKVKEDINPKTLGNIFTNITYPRFGFLLDEEGDVIDFPTNATATQYNKKYSPATLPSHWEFCSWKLTKDLRYRNDKLFSALPDLFHCDGKCNTNNGDDQEWIESRLGVNQLYFDRNTRTIKKEEYISSLERDINKCYMDNMFNFGETMCHRFESLVQNCTALVGQCLGDIAVREVVMSHLLRKFDDFDYSDSECKEGDQTASASNPTLFWGNMILVMFIVKMY